MSRTSGIILPIFSLPSPHGIGSLGKSAYEFVDFLAQAGQSWWQILPVGPTSFGDSPYQSPSTFAGNPYFVDLDLLVADGLLTSTEVDAMRWGSDPTHVDYSALYVGREPLLRRAFERGWERDQAEVERFVEAEADWLPDYALFMAAKRRYDMRSWVEWPDEDVRLHRPEALERLSLELQDDVRYHEYVQYLFFGQWERLRAYAHEHGVRIIGDLPIYVALDSADVWANPELFQLDERNVPVAVAGVPPDAFTDAGQLWGNPLYRYDLMAKDGYAWWLRRVAGAGRLYDKIRIDHFRGFASYWSVPYGETTAKNGHWVKGPGIDLVGLITSTFKDLSFIAEDLGYPTPDVAKLLQDSGLPGMKLLQFAFDTRDSSAGLPHVYPVHCVCYTGTHDNAPIVGWRDEVAPADLALAKEYLGLSEEEGFVRGFVRGGMASAAELFVAQMQDYLGLGSEARINTPGLLGGNWQWRLLPGQASPELASRIAKMTELYGRSAASHV